MWPFERQADVVRVGRNRIEYWASSARGLVLRGEQALGGAGGPQAAGLAASLGRLLQAVQSDAAMSRRSTMRVDVVFESAWLPIMLIEVGQSPWSRRPLVALLRHRFSRLYNERDDPISAWHLQLDHRAGDARGLGYGLAPSIRQAAIDATGAAGLRLASLQPAFSWGWQRLQRHRRSRFGAARRDGWWLWIEQDRAMACCLDARGHLQSLNAGAAVPEDAAQCQRLIEIEALRQGSPAQEARGVVAGWQLASHASRTRAGDRLSFVTVAAEGAVQPFGAAAPVHAGARG